MARQDNPIVVDWEKTANEEQRKIIKQGFAHRQISSTVRSVLLVALEHGIAPRMQAADAAQFKSAMQSFKQGARFPNTPQHRVATTLDGWISNAIAELDKRTGNHLGSAEDWVEDKLNDILARTKQTFESHFK